MHGLPVVAALSCWSQKSLAKLFSGYALYIHSLFSSINDGKSERNSPSTDVLYIWIVGTFSFSFFMRTCLGRRSSLSQTVYFHFFLVTSQISVVGVATCVATIKTLMFTPSVVNSSYVNGLSTDGHFLTLNGSS